MKEWKSEGQGQNASAPVPEGESRKAAARAMKLLLLRMRSVKEIREKLLEESFSEEAVEEAVRYCESFGYLNDGRFAENYTISRQKTRSRQMIRRELAEKGVAEADIDRAFEEVPSDEDAVVFSLIRQRAKVPHRLDDKEVRRLYGYLARRGFSSAAIWRGIHAFEDGAKGEA